MRKYLSILLVLALGNSTRAEEIAAPKTAGASKPNIIFILSDDLGVDIVREVKFNMLRQDLIDTNVEPEIGDIVMWQENYYEIDNITENQLFLGKDNAYSLTDYGSNFGASVSLILECHLTRSTKVAIVKDRL